MSKCYCPLHLHTQTSLLDGIIRTDELAKHLKANGMSSCAISDHGSLGGIIDFYKDMKKEGVHPVIGVESYCTWDQDGLENKDKTKDNMHCIMLAQNEEGLANLIWLTNRAYLHNFYYKPRISIQNLEGRTNGIIATSSCLGGVVSKTGVFDEGNKTFDDIDNKAQKQLELFSTLFGGRFYAEVQDLPVWEQKTYNDWLIKKARDMSIPLVITSDAHFLTEDDYETHRLVMAKNTGKVLNDYKEDDDGLIYHRVHHVRTPEDMYQSACSLGVEDAFFNTTKIAEECNLEIKLGEYKYPQFDIESEPDFNDFLSWEQDRFECNSEGVTRR